MVNVLELVDDLEFQDLCEDVRLECQQYGEVVRVLIPRVKDQYPAACEGSIFVQFATIEAAERAAAALTGRKFENKTVNVDYVSDASLFLHVFHSMRVCSML